MREILAETGLTATGYRYRGLVTFLSDRWPTEYMHLFTVHSWTGELKECDEGDLEWVPKARLKELPLWDGDHIFLDLLDQEAPFFSLKLSYVGDKLVAVSYTHLDVYKRQPLHRSGGPPANPSWLCPPCPGAPCPPFPIG